ncbi:hypothetical protein Tco_0289898 [Tanacetum coccineum]
MVDASGCEVARDGGYGGGGAGGRKSLMRKSNHFEEQQLFASKEDQPVRSNIKGTDDGTWDDFVKSVLVDRIEGQKKFLFTYGIGEVIINNEKSGCMIPGVHYAPEITLNILSIDLLRQQGFELIFEEGKCTLESHATTKQGKNLDVDRMKQMHNNYLDDYFDSLDKERIDREVEKARFLETTEQPEVHNFHGFMDFLDLIKKDDINMGGYLSVHFGLEFGALAEVLARAPQTILYGIGEGSESLDEYQWKIDEKDAPEAVGKGKEKLEHFGIKLEEEEESKQSQTTVT